MIRLYLDISIFESAFSFTYAFPPGFTVETLPREVHLTASFGTFRARTILAGDTAQVSTRVLHVTNPTVPAARYQEFRQFFADVVKADRALAVLVRKPGLELSRNTPGSSAAPMPRSP